MHLSEQRWPCVAEKLTVQQTRRGAPGMGGEIRDPRCGAVAGKSLHGPMT
jgi:hypothetical protein